MGYSNNKWRKILTILMIINLCFILFAKITKSFGATTVTYDNITIPITDSLINTTPYYAVFATDNVYNYSDGSGHYFFLVRSNSPIQAQVNINSAVHLIAYNLDETGIDSYMAFGTYNNTGFPAYMNNTTFTTFSNNNTSVGAYGINSDWTCVISNHDIKNYDDNSEILFPNNSFNAPFFDNVTEIENGNPDGVFISVGDYSKNDNLYFHLLEINTGLSNSDNSIYYYSDKTFLLNKDSKYYSTWLDPSIDGFYYYIPRYKLSLSQDTSYLYVLNNSKEQIQNSYGLYAKDISNGIYDVVQSDTAGVITATEEETDRMRNIEETLVNNQNSMDDIQNNLNNSNVTEETETNIDSSLSFDNSAPDFSNLYGSFFSRLSSTISELGDYDLSTVESINIPIPFTNKQITINSDIVSGHLPQILTTIFNTFWLFIFGKYFIAYILYIYRQIASGHILEGISSNNEVITNDVL